MRRSFGGGGGGGMGRGSGGGGGGGGMLRSVHRAIRAGVGAAPPEPFSPSANSSTSTTIATANSRKARQFNKHQSAPPNAALTLSSSSGGPNNSNPNNNNNGQSSSAFSTLINLPKSGASGAAATAWGSSCSDIDDDDDIEWECVNHDHYVNNTNNEDERAIPIPINLLYEDFVFGTVPSTDEVNYAISSLQQVFEPSSHARKEKLSDQDTTCNKDVGNEDNNRTAEGSEKIYPSSSESEVDWIEPSLNLHNSRVLQPYGSDRVYDAFHLLQSEPSVQRMVVELSSDKAVWDAVLNNEFVKELRGSIGQADEQGDGSSDDDNNAVKDILSWVFVNTKAKIMQLIDKITELASEVIFPPPKKGGTIVDPLQEKLKTCLFVSIIVLLIVVVTRAKSA